MGSFASCPGQYTAALFAVGYRPQHVAYRDSHPDHLLISSIYRPDLCPASLSASDRNYPEEFLVRSGL